MNVELYKEKAVFVKKLGNLLAEEGVVNIQDLDYSAEWNPHKEQVVEEWVTITFDNGYKKHVSVMADSKLGIIRDIMWSV